MNNNFEQHKRFNFGKIDAYGNGEKVNSVDIDVYLKDTPNGKEFTASGLVWNSRHDDCVMGGQCLDDLMQYSELANNKLYKKIYKFWTLYHLNGMHAGTKEQEKFIAKHKDDIHNIFKELALHRTYVSTYEATCELLKRHNLYEVQYNGKPYKYGHGWLFYKIPTKDLKEIEKLFEE